MVRVTCADLTIDIINDSEHGGSGFRIHLYDHLSVVPAMAVAWNGVEHGKAEFKVHSLNLDKCEPPVDLARKTQTRTTSCTIQQHEVRDK
jgi:hypothetical protein